MPTPKMSDAMLHKSIEAYRKHGPGMAAAKSLGISECTLRNRIAKARERGMLDDEPKPEPAIVMPQAPDPNMPIEETVAWLAKQSRRRLEAHAAMQWHKIKVNDPLPFGIVAIGDPHLDDSGCNWALLQEHVRLIRETDGLYCVGMGDYSNNWVGRLARLYANQETSHETALRLVEWFIGTLAENGKLLLLIKGNHDMWSGVGDPIKWMTPGGTLQQDWVARLDFTLPNRSSFKMVAAHDFPGHSMHNILHSNGREAKMGVHADVYLTGHKHSWGVHHTENGKRAHVYWLARARGYKFADEYSTVNGYDEQQFGASITTIVNPLAKTPVSRVTCFADVEEAADYLAHLRQRASRKAA